MVFNKKIPQNILIDKLALYKDKISLEYNYSNKYTYFDFINGNLLSKFDTYITYVGNFLIVRFYKKKTEDFVNLMIITKKSSMAKINFDFLNE